MNRKVMLDRIGEKGKEWDVVVIGGGATGLGTALEAVSRGYKTLLLEQHDFSKGTSSRSTKLIHGGIRYRPHRESHQNGARWRHPSYLCHRRQCPTAIRPLCGRLVGNET